MLIEAKSLLAKLLAQENITVQHLDVETASFNTETRVLTCPIWKDMTGEIYDLCMGHECGHAIYTPPGEYLRLYKERGESWGGFLQITEDARIEKKMKLRYPGLRRSFMLAYGEFIKRDMFGIAKLHGDLSQLNLIDRINVYFKCGVQMPVPFNKEELELVRLTGRTETFEQVIDVTQKIWEYVKQNEQDKCNSQKDLDKLLQDIKDGKVKPQKSNGPSSGEEIEIPNQDDGGVPDQDDEGEESDDADEAKETGDQSGTQGSQAGEKDPESITNRIFQQREHELVDANGMPHIFLDLPECDLDRTVVPFKKVCDQYEGVTIQSMAAQGLSYTDISDKVFNLFQKRNRDHINLLVKEFEMRKNATQYARQLESKSGELDMRRLHQYKFTNDIFRKMTTVPKGKNHGMIMMVDMSDSMERMIYSTMEQALILAVFCRKVGIPFEIYGFCNFSGDGWAGKKFDAKTPTAFNFSDYYFHLKTLITSELNAQDFKRALAMMLIFAVMMHRHILSKDNELSDILRRFMPVGSGGMGLHGTPFCEALVASYGIIKRFKNKTKVDVTNVVYLTDGQGGMSWSMPSMYSQYQSNFAMAPYGGAVAVRVGVVDPLTKVRVLAEPKESMQSVLTRLIKEATGCRHIGFFIASEGEIKSMASELKNPSELLKQLDDHGFFKCSNIGYDSYYYVAMKDRRAQDLIHPPGVSADTVIDQYQYVQKNKRNARFLVSNFAAEIATQLKGI